MNRAPYSFGQALLHGSALLTTFVAFFLLWSGGLVTSMGVGMAVPDWPTTFGDNLFLFPVSKWVGGIFYEHTHRLIASGVGLLTLLLAVGSFILEPRRWVRVFALWLVAAVCLQGLFGGLRVVLNKDQVGILHALLAQSFLCGLLVFCVVTCRAFVAGRWADYDPNPGPRRLALVVTGVLFAQLALGATMRHEHIGLAVPDFPLAYGQVLPDTAPEAMGEINQQRAEKGQVPIKAEYVWVHMAHRAVALVLSALVVWFFVRSRTCSRGVRRMAAALLLLVLVQIALGAWTVWSGKAIDVATTHMALGALVLGLSVLLSFRLIMGSRVGDFALPDAPRQARFEMAV